MSFEYVPSNMRFPDIPGLSPSGGLWRGIDEDDGLFAIQAESYSFGRRLIVEGWNFCYRLSVNGNEYRPVFSDINGHIYWDGYGYIYFTRTYGWVQCGLFPGYEPLETYGRETREYGGDSFYTFSAPPWSDDSEVTMTPRGRLRNGETKVLKAVWPRWVAKGYSEFGEYEAAGGAEGVKILGLPRWRANGRDFIRSFSKKDGHFTYGEVHYANGKWLIGDEGSAAGWHEGSEPSKEGATVFAFRKPEDSDISGTDISLVFKDYVCGEERNEAYMGEAAIWR